jgi:hypothetical protein
MELFAALNAIAPGCSAGRHLAGQCRFFLYNAPAGARHMLDNDSARAAWFEGFDAWQSGFNRLLKSIVAGESATAAGTTFLRDVMVPWMDQAKDRLLRAVSRDVLAVAEKATRLDALVNKNNR